MPCYQPSNLPSGFTTTGRPSYKTEAECNQACQEGACCDGTTCTVKPACQCQGTGKAFKGVGTTCEGNPCGCCCVNGSVTQHNEQQCANAGGTWKPYRCNKPPPSQIPLVLSLTDYTTSGGDRFNFSCARGTHMLNCCVNGVGIGSGYNKEIVFGIVVAFDVTTSGTWQSPNRSLVECGCNTARLRLGTIYYHPATLVEPPSQTGVYTNQNPVRACPAPFFISSQNWTRFSLVPNGSILQTNDGPYYYEMEIPDFCSGQFSISGIVVGPGNVTCGNFTFGNPLP